MFTKKRTKSALYSPLDSGTILRLARREKVAEEMQISISLFITAFLAATILPVASEPAVLAALTLTDEPWSLIIAAASLGNILGAVVNWWLGGLASNAAHSGWLPVSREAREKAEGWYRRWGRASLLLSWAPFIGDALTVAAGVMREPIATFLVLVGIAKTARYLALAASVSGISLLA